MSLDTNLFLGFGFFFSLDYIPRYKMTRSKVQTQIEM